MSNQIITHEITQGDTTKPLGCLLTRFTPRGERPVDLTGRTLAFAMVKDDGDGTYTSVIAQTTSNVTIHPTTTFTADASLDTLTAVRHTVNEGDEIGVSNSGGALPTGLAAGTRYFAINCADDTFQLSATRGGSAIDIAGAGTGTHSFYKFGTVQYDFQSADVANVDEDEDGNDVARTCWAWFVDTTGGETDHFPHDGNKLRVLIHPKVHG